MKSERKPECDLQIAALVGDLLLGMFYYEILSSFSASDVVDYRLVIAPNYLFL